MSAPRLGAFHERACAGFTLDQVYQWPDTSLSYPLGKRAAGRLLDGRTWDEIPAVTG